MSPNRRGTFIFISVATLLKVYDNLFLIFSLSIIHSPTPYLCLYLYPLSFFFLSPTLCHFYPFILSPLFSLSLYLSLSLYFSIRIFLTLLFYFSLSTLLYLYFFFQIFLTLLFSFSLSLSLSVSLCLSIFLI